MGLLVIELPTPFNQDPHVGLSLVLAKVVPSTKWVLERQPANGEYQDDDGDQLHHPLLGLQRLYVHSGPAERILKGEIGSNGWCAVRIYKMI